MPEKAKRTFQPHTSRSVYTVDDCDGCESAIASFRSKRERAPISPRGDVTGGRVVNLEHPITHSSQYFTHFFGLEQFTGKLFAVYLPKLPNFGPRIRNGHLLHRDNKRYRSRETFFRFQKKRATFFPETKSQDYRSLFSVRWIHF